MSSLSPSKELTQKAQFALDVGRPDAAVPLLLQALGCVGDGSEGAYIMERLAQAFQLQDEPDAALLWAERAIAAAPDWSWAYLRRAAIFEKRGRLDDALQNVYTARELSPQMAWIYQSLARLFIKKGDYTQATQNAQQFRVLEPENANAYYYLAQIPLEKAEKERNKTARLLLLDEAEPLTRVGLTLDSESPFLQRLMGKLREKQDRDHEAI